MTRLAWLTPDAAPGNLTCYRVFLPAGGDYEAAFRGAFLLLTESWNWEERGAQTPEIVADAFLQAFFHSEDMGLECPGGKLIGEIFLYGSTSAPANCLACDGAQVLKATYPDLYAIVGSNFGSDAGDYFTLPDLRGRVPLGIGQGAGLTNRVIGEKYGYEMINLQVGDLPPHSHEMPTRVLIGGSTTMLEVRSVNASSSIQVDTYETGGGGPHVNMQPFQAVAFYIQAL
jgi:microcystin-dependent protein